MTIKYSYIEIENNGMIREVQMRKKLGVLLSTFMLLGLMASSSAFAATSTVYLPLKQGWNYCQSTRSGNYSYGSAKCNSVYPTNGGTDNLRYIQAGITDRSGVQMSDAVRLDERATTSSKIKIYEGKLNITSIMFRFRGNDPNIEAKTSVTYSGN